MLEKIKEDLKNAMRNKAEFELGVLRMLVSAIHNRTIEKRAKTGSEELTDEEVAEVLQKEVKKRKEAGALFASGGRPELEKKELEETRFISRYLPAEMGEAEIEAVVRRVIEGGAKDFGSVMKETMKELRGRADGRIVSDIIKKNLS